MEKIMETTVWGSGLKADMYTRSTNHIKTGPDPDW